MKSFLKLAAVATVSGAALLASGGAQASSFSLRSGTSTEGLGLAYAGSASGGIGLGSIGYNPAAITMFPGRQSQYNFTYILPEASFTTTDPATLGAARLFGNGVNTGDVGNDGAFVPASYTVYQFNDRLFFGLANTAPFGLRSKPEIQNFVGQVYGRSSKVRSINVAPTVGYRVNDWFSIGAAVQVQYFSTDLKQAIGPQFGAPNSILRGDDISYGFRVGATVNPWAGGTFGLGYRSSIRHELQGEFITPATFTPIRAQLNLPDSIIASFSQQFTPELQGHFSFEWTNWSRFRRIPVLIEGINRPLTSLNFEYEDSYYFAAGLEYAYNPALTLRAGIAYELSAVNDRVRTVRISDNDRLWLSAGFGYQLTQALRLDASYSHLFVKDAPVNITAGNPSFVGVPYVAEAEPSIDIFSLSLTYRFDTPAVAVLEEKPIIRKY